MKAKYVFLFWRKKQEPFFWINVVEELDNLMGENEPGTLTHSKHNHTIWTVRNAGKSSNVWKVLKRASVWRPGSVEPWCGLKAAPKRQGESILTQKADGSGIHMNLISVGPYTATHLSGCTCQRYQDVPNTSSELERLNFILSVHSDLWPPNQCYQFHCLASGKILCTTNIDLSDSERAG